MEVRVLSGVGNKDIKSMDSRLMFPPNKKMSLTFIEMKFKREYNATRDIY